MIDPAPDWTLDDAFAQAVRRYGDRPFLVVPAAPWRDYDAGGRTLTYAEAGAAVDALADAYAGAGYGHGHRIALALDNRLEHVLHRLAMNRHGVSCVPINPEYRAVEIAYLLGHSEAELVVALPGSAERVRGGIAALGDPSSPGRSARPEFAVDPSPEHPSPEHASTMRGPPVQRPSVHLLDVHASFVPPAASSRPPTDGAPTADSESSLLYTSGTTGQPKGCMLSHRYELESGHWYTTRGGLMALGEGVERIYNPLPLYHVNAGVVSLFGAMLSGNCQIQPDRFHPATWWQELAETGATIMHYLGIVAPVLLKQPASAWERRHSVRLGLGAGIEPDLHAAFEDRFGFPLIELWGMTEMVRILTANEAPRMRGTRAFGRPVPGLEVRVVDDDDRDVARGKPGELLVRHSAATPRAGAFSGYLKDVLATEQAWRGGWFHTGDVVRQSDDGMVHFVDRKKNIIRRSGENIAAAEVEAWLQTHADVRQVAVMPVADELRDEEVLACIVPMTPPDDPSALARRLCEHCLDNLAYYKAPGWILFMDELPTTGTQKIQKHRLFGADDDPRTRDDIFDLRSLKRRR